MQTQDDALPKSTKPYVDPRRNFLQRSGLLLFGFFSLRIERAFGRNLEANPSGNGLNKVDMPNKGHYFRYPTVGYLPEGFLLVNQYTNRPDGFEGGDTELALWYKKSSHPMGYRNPIAIFFAPDPKAEFVGTRNKKGREVNIVCQDKEEIRGIYHDGCWIYDKTGDQELKPGVKIRWYTGNTHSLIFKKANLQIGIRASQQLGVDLAELLRIAGSIS